MKTIAYVLIWIVTASIPVVSQQYTWVGADSVPATLWGHWYLKGLDCADANNCMVIADDGGDLRRCILQSSDGGRVWKVVYEDTARPGPNRHRTLKLNDISYPRADIAVIAADSGVALCTSDGGTTWFRSLTNQNGLGGKFGNVSMDASLWGIMTLSGQPDSNMVITSDGGKTWRFATGAPKPDSWAGQPYPSRIACTAPGRFVCFIADTINRGYMVSSDEGRTWVVDNRNTYQKITGRYSAGGTFKFTDSLHGFDAFVSIGDTDYVSVINRTTDGGLTWHRVLNGDIPGDSVNLGWAVFGDSLNGLLTEGGGVVILRTRDGGFTWRRDSIVGVAGSYVEPYQPCIGRGMPGIVLNGFSPWLYRCVQTTGAVREETITKQQISMRVTPNPVCPGSEFHITCFRCATGEEYRFELRDLLGHTTTVSRRRAASSDTNLFIVDIPDVPAGGYLLVCSNAGNRATCFVQIVR